MAGTGRSVRIERLHRALTALRSLVEQRPLIADDVVRDALIQRFEFTFEALWKALQERARSTGLEAPAPRLALEAALRLGLIEADEEETAFAMLRMRNLTTHTYDEALARDVEHFVREEALPLIEGIVSRLGD